jgi:hypothetical protein
VWTYATALHEFGHCRAWQGTERLENEAAAWRWARTAAKVWPSEAQRNMVEAVRTYLLKADGSVFTGVLDLETLISPAEYAREQDRRRRRHEREFQQEHGVVACQSRYCLAPGSLAVSAWGHTFVCRTCDESRHLDSAAAALRQPQEA